MSKITVYALLALVLVGQGVEAADEGYRFRDGKCVNERGGEGLNPNFLGECGDQRNQTIVNQDLGNLNLQGIDFSGANFRRVSLNGSNLNGANLSKAVYWGTVNDTDFTNADLSYIEFVGDGTISGANFTNANLNNALISRIKFENVTFNGTSLRELDINLDNFSNCSLEAIDLSFSTIIGDLRKVNSFSGAEGISIVAADLRGLQFANTNLSRSILDEVNADEVNFRRAFLNSASLRYARLNDADLREIQATSANFERVSAGGADFSNSILSRSNFRNATMDFVNLSSSALEGSQFNSASLTDGNLMNVRARDSDFSQTNLSRANLESGQFTNSKFSGANLDSTNMRYVSASYASFADTVLRRTDLSLAVLEGANFRAARLENANLTGAYLVGADFARANLSTAILEGADLSRAIYSRSTVLPFSSEEAQNRGMIMIQTGFDVEFSNINLAIPDDAPPVFYRFTIEEDVEIENMSFQIRIPHTYVGDLVIKLISPGGTEVLLHDNEGGAEDNLDRTFGYNGERANVFESLRGQTAGGQWTLSIEDNAGADTGRLDYVRMIVNPEIKKIERN